MNQAHWLTERLNEERAAQFQKQAETERFAQQASEEQPQQPPRRLLAKFRAELSDLSLKAQSEKPKNR